MENTPQKELSSLLLLQDVDYKQIKVLLRHIEAGSDINHRDKLGNTPIMRAVIKGRADVVEFLINKGADINLKNFEGKDLLELSVEKNNHVIIENILNIRKNDLSETYSCIKNIDEVGYEKTGDNCRNKPIIANNQNQDFTKEVLIILENHLEGLLFFPNKTIVDNKQLLINIKAQKSNFTNLEKQVAGLEDEFIKKNATYTHDLSSLEYLSSTLASSTEYRSAYFDIETVQESADSKGITYNHKKEINRLQNIMKINYNNAINLYESNKYKNLINDVRSSKYFSSGDKEVFGRHLYWLDELRQRIEREPNEEEHKFHFMSYFNVGNFLERIKLAELNEVTELGKNLTEARLQYNALKILMNPTKENQKNDNRVSKILDLEIVSIEEKISKLGGRIQEIYSCIKAVQEEGFKEIDDNCFTDLFIDRNTKIFIKDNIAAEENILKDILYYANNTRVDNYQFKVNREGKKAKLAILLKEKNYLIAEKLQTEQKIDEIKNQKDSLDTTISEASNLLSKLEQEYINGKITRPTNEQIGGHTIVEHRRDCTWRVSPERNEVAVQSCEEKKKNYEEKNKEYELLKVNLQKTEKEHTKFEGEKSATEKKLEASAKEYTDLNNEINKQEQSVEKLTIYEHVLAGLSEQVAAKENNHNIYQINREETILGDSSLYENQALIN